jgi:heat shock protein HspQ
MNKIEMALKVFKEEWDGTEEEVLSAKCRYLSTHQECTNKTIETAFRQIFGEDKELPDFFSSQKVKFQEGQVIEHLKYKYLGVIVAVDETFQADDTWYEHMQCASKGVIREQPWYHVLVHNATHSTYVAQQNLSLLKDPKEIIIHPWLSLLFKGFANKSYLRNDIPWNEL